MIPEPTAPNNENTIVLIYTEQPMQVEDKTLMVPGNMESDKWRLVCFFLLNTILEIFMVTITPIIMEIIVDRNRSTSPSLGI
jgi:hypothetical protein